MLEAVIVIALVLWVAGLLTSVTFGGQLHFLLVLAIIAAVFRIFQGARPRSSDIGS